jgi:hypothetical protein
MKRVFVSYKTEDRDRAGQIVRILRDANLDVWWDQDISPGERWRQSIEENLAASELCLVLWSRSSTGPDSQWVKEEAEFSKQAGKYLGVMIDRISPPFGFSELQSIHASDWDVAGIEAMRQRLVNAVENFASGKPIPESYTTPPPEPSATSKRRWPMIMFWMFLGAPGLIGIMVVASMFIQPLFDGKHYTIKQTVSDRTAPIPSVDVEAF